MSDSSTPELPEEFGNPWMANLEEITPPEPIAFTPQTIGWYLLVGALGIALGWVAWRLWKRWRANAYRRFALAELAEIESPREVPELLKRVAMVAYSRAEVAELSNQAWLGFLDGTLGTKEFTRGVGHLLPELAYDPGSLSRISAGDKQKLLSLARRWIRKHRGRFV